MFLEDPSVLTKDKLKSELLANNVTLPTGEHKKDVYVQLYLKNLTVQNRRSGGAPDAFSSDEDLPPPVVVNRSRSGRKATKKTDKPRPDKLDISDLTDEGLKDQLLKYGISAGPIVGTTRKLYEKKLQKLLDEGPPEAVPPIATPLKADGNQNGNTDSDQYSDREEECAEPEPEPVPVVEKLVRSKGKTPVSLRAYRLETNRYNPEEEEQCLAEQEKEDPPLNVKRRMRQLPHRQDQAVPASDDTDFSESSALESTGAPVMLVDPRLHKQEILDSLQEPSPMLTGKSCKHSTLTPLESAEGSSCISRVPGINSPRLIQDDASIWVQSCSRRTPSMEAPSSRPSNSKPHSSTRFQQPRDSAFAGSSTELCGSQDNSGNSCSLSSSRQSDRKENVECATPSRDSQCKGKQQKITSFLTVMSPVRTETSTCTPIGQGDRGVEQRPTAGDQSPSVDGKDILKEMFPDEVSTPTGISATCRRPIRGAAGRPLAPSDFWLDESLRRRTQHVETSSYVESRSTSRLSAPLSSASSSRAVMGTAPPPASQACTRRSFPVWVQLLLLSAVAGFLFFVYQAMETNQMNPFRQESAAVPQPGSIDKSTSK